MSELQRLFTYDPLTGEFRRKVLCGGRRAGERAGTRKSGGYRTISVNGTLYAEHRLAFFFVHGLQPAIVDHKNGKTGDNRIANLRAATHGQNMTNGPVYKSNKLGLKGVAKHAGGKFVANVYHNGKQHYLGLFMTAAQARRAYLAAAKRLHGEFAYVGGVI
ncbi:MAG: HNH endonuclease [bacterium]|nr:HNH endonuclease [bacterium]